jgi:hypothetical protein
MFEVLELYLPLVIVKQPEPPPRYVKGRIWDLQGKEVKPTQWESSRSIAAKRQMKQPKVCFYKAQLAVRPFLGPRIISGFRGFH